MRPLFSKLIRSAPVWRLIVVLGIGGGFGIGEALGNEDEIFNYRLDNGQEIAARLIGIYSGVVFLESEKGKTSYVSYNDLDEASRAPVNAWFQDYLRKAQEPSPLVSESDSQLTTFLSGNLQVWSEGKLVDYDFAAKPEPEFYAFYYSAHWCGPCRAFTPKLRAFYKGMRMLGYENFEIIFVSSDTTGRMMKKYMSEDEMPWPALKFAKRDNRLVARYKGNGIPCLVITDRNGKLLAHSYQGSEYLGPSVPKDFLQDLLKYTDAVQRRVDEVAKGENAAKP